MKRADLKLGVRYMKSAPQNRSTVANGGYTWHMEVVEVLDLTPVRAQYVTSWGSRSHVEGDTDEERAANLVKSLSGKAYGEPVSSVVVRAWRVQGYKDGAPLDEPRVETCPLSNIIPMTYEEWLATREEHRRATELRRAEAARQAEKKEARESVLLTAHTARVDRLKELAPELVGNELRTERPVVILPLEVAERLLLHDTS